MANDKVTERDLEKLCELIINNLKEEFAFKHMSKNLIDTIKIENMGDTINIYIPAQTYNMLKFQHQGVVIHTSHGSYASKLDIVGSEFYIYPENKRSGAYKVKPHNHIGYIERCIKKSIEEWSNSLIGKKIESLRGI